MKNALSALACLVMLGCMTSAVSAAELLDVKPVVAGNAVSIEISADIAMTYTYYKVPGQARAVVDIAEADPEKVEPLIVVNKGAVSSISVDKAQISGIVVSRIIFNLVSETDIAVSASPDRKKLTVTFGGSQAANAVTEPKPETKPVPVPEPAAKPASPSNAPEASQPDAKSDDPLGLDEPATKETAPITKATAAAASEIPTAAAPIITRVPKLEPVVPIMSAPSSPSAMTIRDITTGAAYIEIRANQAIVDYKATMISGPARLILDIPHKKIQQKAKTISIHKFGITKARIGVSPKNIRIVLDSGKAAGFPAHTITSTEDGLRINFK